MLLIGLVCGIVGQNYIKLQFMQLAVFLLVANLVLLIFILQKRDTIFLKIMAVTTFFVLGAFAMELQKIEFKRIFKAFEGQSLEFVAEVFDKRVMPQKTRQDVAETLSLYVSEHDFSLLCYSKFKTGVQVGDTVKIGNVKIKKAKALKISGNTSYQKYLYKEGFLSGLFLTKKHALTICNRPGSSIARWIWNLRTRIYTELQEKISPPAFAYLALIFLGNTQQPEITQMRETFNCWGLSHYLARSGLHIVLFILIWTFLLRFLPININLKRLFLIMLCIIYKLLSWSSIPFIRAFYAFLLIENGKIFNLQTDFLHLLSIICMAVLLFNPLQLFFLDFQLSFGLTFALSWMLRYF